MKNKRLLTILGLFVITLAAVYAFAFVGQGCPSCEADKIPEGCTSIIVGKNASTDGSVMCTHAADCGMCDFTWHYIPAADYKPDAKRKIYHIHQIKTWHPHEGAKWEKLDRGYTDVDIPQVPHTYAYMHSVFGYMNENQVAFGEATIGCQRKMMNTTPSAIMDITMLTLLAMERSKTAREAIQVMGSMGEKYGYGFHDTGEMLAVIDPNEAWIFEIMPVGPLWTPESGKPGAVWAAQRVPDDHVSVCPNESRIGEIDFDNKDYFMYSKNVKQVAIDMGFWDPDSGTPFSFKRSYSPSVGSAAGTQARRGRVWRFFDLVAPSKNFSVDLPNMDFPFSVKPDKQLSPADVMALTRDKYQGNQYDPAKGLKGGPFSNPNYFKGFQVDDARYNGPRCISVANVEYTTLAQCRSWLPNPIGGICWIALGAQDTSCYIPFYAGVTRIPESYTFGDHWIFDRGSARWAFDYVDFHTQVAYSHAIKDVKQAQETWEMGGLEKTALTDKIALELYKQNPAQAVEYVTDFSNNYANRVIDAWWHLGDQLLVKYNHFGTYNSQTRKTGRLSTPEWWNRAVIEHDKLEPVTPPQKKN